MNFIHQIIQALQTSTSDNLKYAPSGESVTERTLSLANKLEELYSQESFRQNIRKEEEKMTRALFLGMLSRNQDTFKLEKSLEDWVKKVFLLGAIFDKEYIKQKYGQ